LICNGTSGTDFLAGTDDSYYPGTVSEARLYTPTGDTLYRNTLLLEIERTLSERLEISGRLGYTLTTGSKQAQTVTTSCTVAYALR